MKKCLKFLFILFISIISFNVKALELDINSNNAIFYNLDNKKVLFEKNSDEKVEIASLTKLMTSLVVMDKVDDLDQQVVITSDDFRDVVRENLVTAKFTVGQVVTYRDLLYGLLLPSGADAAKALARNIAGSEDEFVKLMNEKVKELKLNNTEFSNVIGLDSENNYSTAKDVAVIFSKVLENDELKEIITTSEHESSDGKLLFKSTIKTNAKKYGIDVPYILGGKTGTTSGAGLCLASIARGNDINYMLITLGAKYDKIRPHHIDDAKVIYDYFIENYDNHKIVDKKKSFKTIKVKWSNKNKLKLYPKNDVVEYLPNDYDKKKVKITYKGLEEISPFEKGKIGEIKIYYDNSLIETQDIYLSGKIRFSLVSFVKDNLLFILIPFVIVFFVIIKRARK